MHGGHYGRLERFYRMIRDDGSELLLPIGIGTPIAERPSHSTGRAGTYPAVRLVKAGTNKIPYMVHLARA